MSKTRRRRNSNDGSRSEVLVLEHVDTIREYTEVCVAEASSGGQDSLKVAVAAILQLVREQASERKALVHKSTQGVELLLTCLKDHSLDHETVHTILTILKYLADRKYKVRLVKGGAGETLLQMLASSAHSVSLPYQILLISLLLQLSPKVTKFSLKARLYGALPATAALLKHSMKEPHTHSLAVLLNALRVMATNSTSAAHLCRLGCVATLSRLLSLHGTRDNSLLRHILKSLIPLLKTKSVCSRRATGTCVQQLVSLHERLHRVDTNVRHTTVRKNILTALSVAVATDTGMQAFHKTDGLKIMYDTAQELHEEEHKRLHSLANSVCTLLRKCLPKLVLPVPSLNHPLSFSLPSKAVLASPTGRLPVKDKPTAPLQPSLSPSHLPLLTTSQPFLGTVSPTQSATSCPTFSTLPPSTFPSSSPQSMSHNLSSMSKTQATDNCVSDWRECSVTQGGYTQDESAVRSTRGREMVVKLPQVTQDNVFGEGKPHAVEDERAQNSLLTGEDDMVTHGQNSAVWFIGVTPSGYRQKPVQSIDHEGDKEEELEDLSQFNAFFPELHVHTTSIHSRRHSSSAPVLSNTASSNTQPVQLSNSYPAINSTQSAEETANTTRKVVPLHCVSFSELDMPKMVLDSYLQSHCDDCVAVERGRVCGCSSCKEADGGVESGEKEVLFPHKPTVEPELDFKKKLALDRSLALMDTLRFIEPHSFINKVVYSLDDDLQQKLQSLEKDQVHSNSVKKPEESAGIDSIGEEDKKVEQQDTSSVVTSTALKKCSCLTFRAESESSNLRKAIQVRSHEYDLLLSPDINSDHHHQWFLFMVNGIEADMKYRFNIINCEKPGSQFNSGMQPLFYSCRQCVWRRVGTDIAYYKNNFVFRKNDSFSPTASSTSIVNSTTRGTIKTFYTLTFSVVFPHSAIGAPCYLAYHYPFTYSMLQAELSLLEKDISQSTTTTTTNSPFHSTTSSVATSSSSAASSMASSCSFNRLFYHRQTLCHTLGGHQCHLLTITNLPQQHSNEEKDEKEGENGIRDDNSGLSVASKQYVVLTARVHPGESNSSWIMKGTVRYLLSTSPEAVRLRDRFVFKIVPMLNPDGVINGSHRCSLTGQDLNRQWISPDPSLHPTIYHTKRLIHWLKAHNKTPFLCCDYHGHSRRKNVFMYGCSDHKSSSVEQGLPVVLDQLAPLFNLQNCSFKVEKSKEATARVVLWREMGVSRSYTMESTYCGADQGVYKGQQVSTEKLEEMGQLFCLGLLKLVEDPPTIIVPDTSKEETLTSRAGKIHQRTMYSRSRGDDSDDGSSEEEEEEEEQTRTPTEGYMHMCGIDHVFMWYTVCASVCFVTTMNTNYIYKMAKT